MERILPISFWTIKSTQHLPRQQILQGEQAGRSNRPQCCLRSIDNTQLHGRTANVKCRDALLMRQIPVQTSYSNIIYLQKYQVAATKVLSVLVVWTVFSMHTTRTKQHTAQGGWQQGLPHVAGSCVMNSPRSSGALSGSIDATSGCWPSILNSDDVPALWTCTKRQQQRQQ